MSPYRIQKWSCRGYLFVGIDYLLILSLKVLNLKCHQITFSNHLQATVRVSITLILEVCLIRCAYTPNQHLRNIQIQLIQPNTFTGKSMKSINLAHSKNQAYITKMRPVLYARLNHVDQKWWYQEGVCARTVGHRNTRDIWWASTTDIKAAQLPSAWIMMLRGSRGLEKTRMVTSGILYKHHVDHCLVGLIPRAGNSHAPCVLANLDSSLRTLNKQNAICNTMEIAMCNNYCFLDGLGYDRR